jgi:hypothetical protein
MIVLAVTLRVNGARERRRHDLERIDANRREQRQTCGEFILSMELLWRDTDITLIPNAVEAYGSDTVDARITISNENLARSDMLLALAKTIASGDVDLLAKINACRESLDRFRGNLASYGDARARRLGDADLSQRRNNASISKKATLDAVGELTDYIESHLGPTIATEGKKSGN